MDKTIVATPLADLRTAKIADLTATANEKSQEPYAFDFGSSQATSDSGQNLGNAGQLHIQMQNTADNPDQDNWRTVYSLALTAIVNNSSATLPIRVQENITVASPPQQVITLLSGAAQRNSTITIQTLPGLKLMVNNATNAVDIEAVSWPPD